VIAYFDTSAVVPLLVDDEPGAAVCRRVWELAESVVTTRLLYVEAAAALARAGRMGRLTVAAHDTALDGLDEVWMQFDVVEVTDVLIRRAATLARDQQLRGFDAVHCAAGLSVAVPGTLALTGDRDLLAAWCAHDLETVDTRA
jgi:uncharacterized protein